MIRIEVDDVRAEGPLDTHWDVLVHVVGSVRVTTGAGLWLADPELCVVELADAAAYWLSRPVPVPFVYSSLESSEPWLLRFAEREPGRWAGESPWQLFRNDETCSLEELRHALVGYVVDVSSLLPERQALRRLLSAEATRYADLLALIPGQ